MSSQPPIPIAFSPGLAKGRSLVVELIIKGRNQHNAVKQLFPNEYDHNYIF